MATVAAIVDQALKAAGIPIRGVAIGTEADRTTWSVQFDPSATAAQRTQAQSLINTVAIDASAQSAQDQKDAQLQVDTWPIVTKAIVLALIDEINVLRTEINTLRAAVSPPLTPPLPARTPAQAITAIRNKAGTL